ncbi:MAG: D-alanyl-D-alanine carboxypeptidase/D-alanyl-D-alanine-endopeptidase [Muribaculaceae bacterium]|nr:D-alanyl-D-alanine carboxypeptidase/D-alanyl-D-alanine-endopeptidase [Muribaculaceae bacterium]
MFRLASSLFLLVSAGIALGQCPLTFKDADKALIGVYVAPVDGSTPLADYNADRLFTPASVMKAVTVAAAISRHGGDYRWQTTVSASGNIIDGTLEGNIIVAGSGDPTLGSEYFKEGRPGFLSSVKSAAEQAGILRVAGRVEDGSAAWPNQGPVPSWEIEDIPGVDGAGFYSLNYSDNTFSLIYPSMKTSPRIPELNIRYRGGQGVISFFRNPGSNDLNIYGQLSRKQKRVSLKCSMPYPPLVLLSELDSLFQSEGREFRTVCDTTALLVYKSPQLRDIARSLMFRSDNQMAEAALRLLAPRQSRAKAIAAERSLLTNLGVDLSGARIADGSGLSRHNAISPRQLANVLKIMARNGDYVGSFARVGLDGTVRSLMSGVPGRENFVLKSGSMTGVVCYVGYRLNPSTKSPTHVIAIMVNNAPVAKDARTAIAKLLSELKF